jgi:hypothetical protein
MVLVPLLLLLLLLQVSILVCLQLPTPTLDIAPAPNVAPAPDVAPTASIYSPVGCAGPAEPHPPGSHPRLIWLQDTLIEFRDLGFRV